MDPDDYRFIRELYAAEIRYVDEFLGSLFSKLKQLALYDSTLIVFLSDHGESLGERDRVGHNQLYDVQLKVPLVLRIPGLGPEQFTEPVELMDVMPTLFSLLDIEPPYDFQGANLLPLLMGREKLPRTRPRFSQQLRQAAVEEAGWKVIFNTSNRGELIEVGAAGYLGVVKAKEIRTQGIDRDQDDSIDFLGGRSSI